MSGHHYLDGVLAPAGTEGALPSVTTILSVRANPGLQAWRDRVGAEAADKRRDESADLGTRVHQAIEQLIKGAAIFALDTDFETYVQGFQNWHDKVAPATLQAETFVTSAYGYAGTIDLICEIDGEPWIIDFKTGGIKPEHGLQLAAYAQAWAEGPLNYMPRRAVLQLTTETKKGWRFREFSDPDDWKIFLAHKEIYDWNCKHNPLKLPTKWNGGVIVAT